MLNLVVTHGRDNPFGNARTMGDEFENWLRFGLDRISAPFASTIPFSFAFYGDLWRPDAQAAWGQETAMATPDTTRLEVSLAREVILAANPKLAAGDEGFIAVAAVNLVNVLQQHVPDFVSQKLLEWFAKDTAQYFSVAKLRNLTMDRLVKAITTAQGDVVLLAHSMGSIVAYDLLMRRPDLPVRAFISFGAPLGMDLVHQHVADANGNTPFPPNLARWINIYNQEDFVANASPIAAMYPSSDGRHVEDIDTGAMSTPNVLKIFAGHDPKDYLSSLALANSIRSVVEQT